MTSIQPSTDSVYTIERPVRSILIVRMKSKPYNGRHLPDASFTFRLGEPQFEVWERRFLEQQKLFANSQHNNNS